MGDYSEPLRGVFWAIVDALEVSPASARAFVEDNGESALAVCGALTTIQWSAHLGGNARAPRERIAAARAAFFLHKAVATHWGWMAKHSVSREHVANVSYAEWTAFASNPFVLLPHGIKMDAVLARVTDDTSDAAQRYGHAYALVAARNGVADASLVAAEFDQYSLQRENDFLDFDPSMGTNADHVFACDEDSETFADASNRLDDGECNVGAYLEYWRLRNALVSADGRIWFRDVRDAETRLPVLLAAMIARGQTDEEKKAVGKKKPRFIFST